MTQILAYADEKNVVLLSDRRLTNASNGKPITDTSNKSVLWADRLVFGYTGLAYIGSERTDRWLAQVVHKEISVQNIGEKLAREATVAFRSLRGIKSVWKHHAFMGVGWVKLNGSQQFTPIKIIVTNTDFKSKYPRSGFTTHYSTLPPSQAYGLDWCGAPLNTAQINFLNRCLRRYHKCGGGGAIPILRLFEIIITNHHNTTVGKYLLEAVLPRPSGPTVRTTWKVGPSKDTAWFLTRSPIGAPQLPQQGPILSGHGTIMTLGPMPAPRSTTAQSPS